ncbi:MAG: nitrilase-related carbon-nitrogen hydrolase [Anaerolineae bacterium]
MPQIIQVGIAQIAPVWLNREQTLAKIARCVKLVADEGCQLVTFGEALLPGYPFWIERTDGARFNSPVQKEIHAHYLHQAVQIEAGHLELLCDTAVQHQIAVIVGCIERARDRGGHSLYCSLVYVDSQGVIQSVHRKLMPTYEERLAWAPGDGHGLRVHQLGTFTVGEERLIVAAVDHKRVRAERQNFDPAGHYARPDVTHLTVNRKRQRTLTIVE